MKDRKWLKSRLDVMFSPRTVAMVGATNKMMKWGFIILSRMLNEGFEGKIYAINPTDPTVLGIRTQKSILEVPGEIDLAVIVTPSAAVPQVMRECAQKRVPAAVVITSNFSETGASGARLEEEVVKIARAAQMIVVGPNTMGICNTQVKLNCLMAPVSPRAGTAACIAQSGNVGTHMLFRGRMRGLGFGKFVSSGNEGDLTFEDYLWYFGEDPATSAVLGYLEGLDPGGDFVRVAQTVSRKKPIIILKGGRTKAGSRAAAAHTGALAGDLAVATGAMRQAGVILADSNQQVVELARAFELSPKPRGGRVGILTRGGGWGVITADACVEHGLELAVLEDRTIAALDQILPAYWSRGNPVDMVAVMEYRAYIDCLELMVQDPNVDAVIALGASIDHQSLNTLDSLRKIGVIDLAQSEKMRDQADRDSTRFFLELRDFINASKKPILSVGRWKDSPDWEAGLMMIGEPEEAAALLAKMVEYGQFLEKADA